MDNNVQENEIVPIDQTDADDEHQEVENHWWIKLIEYGIALVIGAALVFTTLGIRGTFNDGISKEILYKDLADAFTIPGIVLVSIGLLVLLSQEGALSGIGYAVSRAIKALIPGGRLKDKSYAEYLASRKEKKGSSAFLLVTGVVFLIVAIIFIGLFNSVYYK